MIIQSSSSHQPGEAGLLTQPKNVLFINEVADEIRKAGRCGILLSNLTEEIFSLLFADDVVLVSHAPVGPQNGSVEKCALLCVFVCCRVTNHRKSLGRYSQFTVCSMCSQSLFCPSSLALFLRKRVPEFSVDFAVPVQRESNLKRSSKRGRRAGVLTRFRLRSLRPPLPATVLTNARSLKNKTDELFQLMSFKREFKDASVLCITETWLDPLTPDIVTAPGHTLFRADRCPVLSQKEKGGGGELLFGQPKMV